MKLLERGVALLASSQLPENVVTELKHLLCEIAKGIYILKMHI